MRFPFVKKLQINENGGVMMMMSLMLLVVLTIVGVMSINMSSNEGNIVRNEQISATELYKAETGLNIARLESSDWMTDPFLMKNEDAADAKQIIYYDANAASGSDKGYKKYHDKDNPKRINEDGTTSVAHAAGSTLWTEGTPYTTKLEIRNIIDYGDPKENSPEPVFGGRVADKIPSIPHFGTPPAGSGSSAIKFQIRRFSITATSDNGTIVQAGVWKVFGNYN